MKELEKILKKVKTFSNYESFSDYIEMKDLSNILIEEEDILCMTVATNKEIKGLLVVTNERILFFSKENNHKPSFEIDFDDIEHIYHQIGEVEIFLSNHKIELSNISHNVFPQLLKILKSHSQSYVQDEEYDEKHKSCLPFVVAIGIFLIIIAGMIQDHFYHNGSAYKENLISLETAQSEYDLFFSSLNFYPIDDLNYLSGTLSNHSDKEYSSILIDIEFYDNDGNVKEQTKERIYNLKPNQTWSFKEDFQSKEIVDFKITGMKIQLLSKK